MVPGDPVGLHRLQNQFRRKITAGLKLSDAVELAQREIVQSFKDKGLSVRTAR